MNSKTIRDFGRKEPLGTAQLLSKFKFSASDLQTVHILCSPFVSWKWLTYHNGLAQNQCLLVSFPSHQMEDSYLLRPLEIRSRLFSKKVRLHNEKLKESL